MAITSSQEAPSFMYDSIGGDTRLKPQFQSIFVNTQPQISRVDQLLQAARERLGNARGAAQLKMRTQEEQGVRPYAPADPVAAGSELANRMFKASVPMPQQSFAPTEIQQRPTGGVVASYGPQERVVTSRYGTGSATVGGTGKPATFDGMSKAAFFGKAAARQGQDNAFARAEKTGKTDKKTGEPLFTSKSIPKGSDARTERVFEAMKSGGKIPRRPDDGYEAKKATEARWKERLSA